MHARRTGYLLAMGLVPVGGVTACSKEPAVTAPIGRETPVAADASPLGTQAVATAQATATAAGVDAKGVRRVDAGGGRWDVYEPIPAPTVTATAAPRGPNEPTPMHFPPCPSGSFCVQGGADAGAHAKAPYADCAASVPGRSPNDNVSFDPELTKSERATAPGACCYHWYLLCPGGRPLREAERAVVAAQASRGDWMADVGAVAVPASRAEREARASYWRAQAAAEHASVASFHRFGLQLLALGAPRDLVRAASGAALDEIRHAEVGYALASRYAGAAEGPSVLTLPAGALACDVATVLRETVRDGCVGEAVAAELVRAAAGESDDPAVRVLLGGIADDETRHAELAFRTVAWLVAEHGAVARAALADALAGLAPELPAGADPREVALASRVVREVVAPCLEALVGASAKAA